MLSSNTILLLLGLSAAPSLAAAVQIGSAPVSDNARGDVIANPHRRDFASSHAELAARVFDSKASINDTPAGLRQRRFHGTTNIPADKASKLASRMVRVRAATPQGLPNGTKIPNQEATDVQLTEEGKKPSAHADALQAREHINIKESPSDDFFPNASASRRDHVPVPANFVPKDVELDALGRREGEGQDRQDQEDESAAANVKVYPPINSRRSNGPRRLAVPRDTGATLESVDMNQNFSRDVSGLLPPTVPANLAEGLPVPVPKHRRADAPTPPKKEAVIAAVDAVKPVRRHDEDENYSTQVVRRAEIPAAPAPPPVPAFPVPAPTPPTPPSPPAGAPAGAPAAPAAPNVLDLVTGAAPHRRQEESENADVEINVRAEAPVAPAPPALVPAATAPDNIFGKVKGRMFEEESEEAGVAVHAHRRADAPAVPGMLQSLMHRFIGGRQAESESEEVRTVVNAREPQRVTTNNYKQKGDGNVHQENVEVDGVDLAKLPVVGQAIHRRSPVGDHDCDDHAAKEA